MTMYLQSTVRQPPILLKREPDAGDESFVAGQWRPTGMIVDWFFGHEDRVEQIDEDTARKLEPDAF